VPPSMTILYSHMLPASGAGGLGLDDRRTHEHLQVMTCLTTAGKSGEERAYHCRGPCRVEEASIAWEPARKSQGLSGTFECVL
jgi:hypothetical protein